MGAKKKNIKFQYYLVCCLDGNNKSDVKFDLLKWIELIENTGIEARIKDVGGIKGRHEGSRKVDNKFYAINFMRLDDYSNSYIVKQSQKAEHIDLQDDEYIGKNTVVLYDPAYHVLMVQVNKGGFGVASIERYINSFNMDKKCYFRPIGDEFVLGARHNEKIMKLGVRFANTRNFRPGKSKDFEQIIDCFNKMSAHTASIEVGLGRTKAESLDYETISPILEDIKANKGNISSARIILNDDQKSMIFDLFDNICHDFIGFVVQANGELGFEYVSDEMGVKYSTSRGRILHLLNQGG